VRVCEDVCLTIICKLINPHLSFEQPVGLSGANPHETRKISLLLLAKAPKLAGSKYTHRSAMSEFEKYTDMDVHLMYDLG